MGSVEELAQALVAASNAVQDEMASEQAAYIALRSHEYKEGWHSGKEIGLMVAGAQDFSARLAKKLAQ